MTQRRIGAVIVDDESLARRGIIARLLRHPDVSVLAEAGNAREAAAAIRSLQPDMVFLDIEMPGVSGLELVRLLEPAVAPLVVLVTAHDDHALEAFDVAAVDYLLKPIDDARFDRALERVRERLARRDRSARVGTAPRHEDDLTRLAVPTGGGMVLLALHEVQWLEADGDHVVVHTSAKSYRMRATLTEMTTRLPADRFRRIHRSAVVSLASVRELVALPNREYQVLLHGGTSLRLSRSYRESLAGLFPAP